MSYLATTRFTNETLKENKDYCLANNETLIYGTMIEISSKCKYGEYLYVFEMNNDLNEIEGVGLIENRPVLMLNDKDKQKYKIYSLFDYNEYIYRGSYKITRKEFKEMNEELLNKCEMIFFRGKGHLKRLKGITLLKEETLKKVEMKEEEKLTTNEIIKELKRMFLKKYK